MNIEKATARVRKLMKLANDPAATPEEAATAAARASELMERYRLGAASIDDDEAADQKAYADEKPTHETVERTARVRPWQVQLAEACARANRCRVYVTPARGITMIGRPSDLQAAAYLYAACRRQVDALARPATRGFGAVYARSWREGCVATIGRRLRESTEAATQSAYQEASGNSNALVRLDEAVALKKRVEDEADRMVNRICYGTETPGRRTGWSGGARGLDAAGYHAGVRAGQSVSLGGRSAGALSSGQKKIGSN